MSIKQIKEICDNHPEYCNAVKYSYSFYQEANLAPESVISPVSPIHDLIVEKVKKYQINRQFLGLVKNSIMWRSEIEQLDDWLPCIHEILQPVRELLYKLLCLSHAVTEYGQHCIDSYVRLRIDIIPETLSALTKLPFDVKTKLMFNALLTKI